MPPRIPFPLGFHLLLLLLLLLLLIVAASIPTSAAESPTCVAVYNEGGAPAVLRSAQCPRWTLLRRRPSPPPPPQRGCHVAAHQGRHRSQEDRLVLLNLRVLKMMHTIASHAAENRMGPSAVATCMAPLLLRPLLAGECEMEDEFDMNGDNAAQLLAAAAATNNAQAIIATLLEEYENIFDDDNLHRCSTSPDSQAEESGSEESVDDGNTDVKENGYHYAENVDLEVNDERVLSGKLSESSGYDGSDLYDYKAFYS